MAPWQETVLWIYGVILAVVAARHVVYEVQIRRSVRLQPTDPVVPPEDAPFVSVLVPAKDEEQHIARCLESLRKLEYANYEILVVDDRSEDRTAEIVRGVAEEDDRVRLVQVKELPEGWTGKTHALQFGQKEAKGEWLLFVDADTQLHPNCLGVVLQDAIANGADMETLVLGMDAHSFWEGAVQPFAGTLLMMLYPPSRLNDPKHPGWGNGQFILVNRETYDAIDRHESVRDKFVEDIHLARQVRKHGRNLRVAMAAPVASVRMYSSLSQIVRGWARIFYSAVDFRTRPLWLLILATLVFSLLNYGILLAGGVAWLAGDFCPFARSMVLLALLHEFLQVTLYWRIYNSSRTPLRYLPARALGAGVMVYTLLTAIRTCHTHEVTWRGTSYTKSIQSTG